MEGWADSGCESDPDIAGGEVIDRQSLEARWLALTREAMPAAAQERRWPVRFDHCFQRILLDAACGGVWYDTIEKRPAYAHAPEAVLREAVRLGEGALVGEVDLGALNRQSLAWRRARKG